MNKTEYIRGALVFNPDMDNKELALKANCTPTMVRYVKRLMREETKQKSTSIVGIVADLHIPAVLPGYREFCMKTFANHGVDQVVFIGDIIDLHAMSRHISEPSADGALREFEKAKAILKEWSSVFTHAKICEGNHDAIPKRQAKEVGIPDLYLRSLNDVYELPATWHWAYSHTIAGVHYDHGLGSSGMYGCKNTAQKMGMSYVQGHTHSNAGVFYMSSEARTIFGMNVGAACDDSNVALSYGRNFKQKQTPGVGIVKHGKTALFLPM